MSDAWRLLGKENLDNNGRAIAPQLGLVRGEVGTDCGNAIFPAYRFAQPLDTYTFKTSTHEHVIANRRRGLIRRLD
jgi:hypothetical protein